MILYFVKNNEVYARTLEGPDLFYASRLSDL